MCGEVEWVPGTHKGDKMAAYDDSYEERQEDEVEFLQAVFPGDFEDLRRNDPWKVSSDGVGSHVI